MNIHFISIGGSVMHQLAIALKQKGYHVTGSDDEIFEPSFSNLQKAGILPEKFGWQPALIHENLDAIILGMHARADNAELQKAKELALPVYSFPEYIYKESLQKIRVAVGGSHGKTTTTGMIMHILQAAEKQFDYLVGAGVQGFLQSVNITNAPIIVCEADEYPASALERRPKFHFLYPHIAVITGIAWDHINVFPTFDNYLEQFEIFINKIETDGTLIYNQTDEQLVALIKKTLRKDLHYIPYGLPQFYIHKGKTYLTIADKTVALKVFGNHNLLNLHAAYFVCNKLGVSNEVFLQAAESFSGAAKRLEIIAEKAECIVYRDFAHAPSKAKATIEALKEQFADKQLIALFELHTYSSLSASFMSHYAGVLNMADDACVFYSSHAMEIKQMPELPKQTVLQGFAKPNLQVFVTKNELETWLKNLHIENTVLVLMSSGNFEGLDVLEAINWK